MLTILSLSLEQGDLDDVQKKRLLRIIYFMTFFIQNEKFILEGKEEVFLDSLFLKDVLSLCLAKLSDDITENTIVLEEGEDFPFVGDRHYVEKAMELLFMTYLEKKINVKLFIDVKKHILLIKHGEVKMEELLKDPFLYVKNAMINKPEFFFSLSKALFESQGMKIQFSKNQTIIEFSTHSQS